MEPEDVTLEPVPPEDPTLQPVPPEDPALQQRLEQAEAAVQLLTAQLAEAAQTYRAALLAAAPEIPPDLVSGQTPEELDRSLAAAHKIVEAVRARLTETNEAIGAHVAHVAQALLPVNPLPVPPVPVPAGAPVRAAPDLSSLSPLEKIKYALGRS